MNTDEVMISAKVFNNALKTNSEIISKTATARVCMAVFYDLRRIDQRYADTKNFKTVTLPHYATTFEP
jgi:hypothetical protein